MIKIHVFRIFIFFTFNSRKSVKLITIFKNMIKKRDIFTDIKIQGYKYLYHFIFYYYHHKHIANFFVSIKVFL